MPHFPKPQRVLIPQAELQQGIRRLGRDIGERFAGQRVLMVPVLSGAFRFAAELLGALEDIPLEIEPVIVQSYVGTNSTEARIDLLRMKPSQVRGNHVLLVDDIFDTGQTLWRLTALLKTLEPASLTSAVMLHKEGKGLPEYALEPEFVGWRIPDEFVVGMGLDYRGFYRNLPYVGVLSPCEQAYVDEALGRSP